MTEKYIKIQTVLRRIKKYYSLLRTKLPYQVQKDLVQKKVKHEGGPAYSSVEVVGLVGWMPQVVLGPKVKLYPGVISMMVHPIEPAVDDNIVSLYMLN